jgi:colanic acid/amylovoran biosynthesis glycosyltransferase
MRKPADRPAYRRKCARGSLRELVGVEHWALSIERWTLEVPSADSRPIIACYCATFLKPEMLHIYRQITALERCIPVVIAQKREQAGHYPFEPTHIVPKPATHFLRRFWFRQLRDAPWQISDRELRALQGTLEKTHARLLHIYFGQIAVHLLPLIRSWKKPSIVSFHGADVTVDMNKPAYREATRQMLDAVRMVLVRSESLRRAVIQLGCDEGKIEIQRTGIPLDEFPFRERSLPQNGEWRFVQAGRLIEKKGLPVTLRAFAVFLREYPNAKLTIAGEGPLLGQLQNLARELNIDGRVSFTGFISQEQLRETYYASHIFLHPSQTGHDGNQEGIPNSMLEAMASGLPVFATQHGGIPEAIENGLTGVLVPEGDHQKLAAALLNAAQGPVFLSRIARNGADFIRKNFDLREQARRLEEIYLRIIQT